MVYRYSLTDFSKDLNGIAVADSSAGAIVAQAKPLLARLIRQPDCIEAKFKQRGATAYGRYMLHRAPRFNVNVVVWGPGDSAKAHNHDTWGLVGVIDNEMQETRFRRKDDGSKPGYAELAATAAIHHRAGRLRMTKGIADGMYMPMVKPRTTCSANSRSGSCARGSAADATISTTVPIVSRRRTPNPPARDGPSRGRASACRS